MVPSCGLWAFGVALRHVARATGPRRLVCHDTSIGALAVTERGGHSKCAFPQRLAGIIDTCHYTSEFRLLFLKNYFQFTRCVCVVCVCVNAMLVCQGVLVEVRTQISGVDSLLLPCGVVGPEHKPLHPLSHLSSSLIN